MIVFHQIVAVSWSWYISCWAGVIAKVAALAGASLNFPLFSFSPLCCSEMWKSTLHGNDDDMRWLTYISLQPVFWRSAKGLLGDVHPPQHHHSPHRPLLDSALHQGDQRIVWFKIYFWCLFPTGGYPGDPGARLLRPPVGVCQTVEVHRLPIFLRHLFRALCCHLGRHQVSTTTTSDAKSLTKVIVSDAVYFLPGSYTLRFMMRATSSSSPPSTTSSSSSWASCSCSTSSGPSCWSRRSEVPSSSRVLTTVAATANRPPWTSRTRITIWTWRRRIDIRQGRHGSPLPPSSNTPL